MSDLLALRSLCDRKKRLVQTLDGEWIYAVPIPDLQSPLAAPVESRPPAAETEPIRCPRCDSPSPHLHPAVQFEGEVAVCSDPFHLRPTPENLRWLPKASSPPPQEPPQEKSLMLIGKLEHAHDELVAAFHRQYDGQRAFKISIPARIDYDTELIIGEALREARAFVIAALSTPPAGPQADATLINDARSAESRLAISEANLKEALSMPTPSGKVRSMLLYLAGQMRMRALASRGEAGRDGEYEYFTLADVEAALAPEAHR